MVTLVLLLILNTINLYTGAIPFLQWLIPLSSILLLIAILIFFRNPDRKINQNESGNLENPIADHFRTFIIKNWSDLFESITDYIKIDMSTLTREAKNYIE